MLRSQQLYQHPTFAAARSLSSYERGHHRVIDAKAPLESMFGYSTAVRSLSQGRASYSMEPLEYAPAPDAKLNQVLGIE